MTLNQTSLGYALLALIWSYWAVQPVECFGPPQPTTPSSSSTTLFWSRKPITSSFSRQTFLFLTNDDGDEEEDYDSSSPFFASLEPDADDSEASSFEDLGLSPNVLSAVRANNYWEQPTPIQQLAIPALLKSTSGETTAAAWCQAPTGSGKTAAFALPLLDKLLTTTTTSGGIRALIVVPTRELAVQVGQMVLPNLVQNLKRSPKQRKLNVQVVHGGVPMRPQLAALPRADIVVATPGRLVDLLQHQEDNVADAIMEQQLLGALQEKSSLSWEELDRLQQQQGAAAASNDGSEALRVNDLLQNLDFLILDEADRLLGRGFDSEMQALLQFLPLRKQDAPRMETWLFSATFPKQMEPRVDAFLQKLGHDQVVRISCAASDRNDPQGDDDISGTLQKRLDRQKTPQATVMHQVGPASTIDLQTIRLDKPQRTQALRKLLETHSTKEWDRVLVFVATRYAAEHVARKLRRAGIESAELHGKLDQEARLRRLQAFSKGRVRVLLATDVASRGLDVVGLPAVVNYDLPRSTADFVHRIGRTGRAGRPGTAITFVTPETEAHYDLIERRHLVEPVERQILKGFEPNEEKWQIKSSAARISIPGADQHSSRGLAHDRMHGGIKGRRKSKKDRLREAAARQAAQQQSSE